MRPMTAVSPSTTLVRSAAWRASEAGRVNSVEKLLLDRVCPFADSIAVLIGGFCDDGSKAGGASCVVL